VTDGGASDENIDCPNKSPNNVSYVPRLAKEIEHEYGTAALEGIQKIGFKFKNRPCDCYTTHGKVQ